MNGPPNPPPLRVVEDEPLPTEDAPAVGSSVGHALASIEHDWRPELPADPTLQSFARPLGHALVVLDADHRIVFASFTPRRTQTSEGSDIRPGAALIEALGPVAAAAIEQAAEQAMGQPEPSTVDWAIVRDGHRHVASASVTRRLDANGRTVGTTAIIRLESEPGPGTTFEVLWPVARQQRATKREPAPARKGPGKTILCVDDERPVLRAIGRALRRLGYTVLTADNAADALQTCAEARAPIDLVITDLTMPGMTGLALASELEVSHPDVAVILSSGVTIPPGQTQIDALLPKPYTIAELSEVVARVLGRRACTIAPR